MKYIVMDTRNNGLEVSAYARSIIMLKISLCRLYIKLKKQFLLYL